MDLEAVFVFIWKDAAGKDGVTIIDEDFDAAVIDEDAQMRQTVRQAAGTCFTLIFVEAAIHVGAIDGDLALCLVETDPEAVFPVFFGE